jgi:hypothetical protein
LLSLPKKRTDQKQTKEKQHTNLAFLNQKLGLLPRGAKLFAKRHQRILVIRQNAQNQLRLIKKQIQQSKTKQNGTKPEDRWT